MSEKYCTNLSPVASKALLCSGCEADQENLLYKVGTKEFNTVESSYHSNYRYLHQRL